MINQPVDSEVNPYIAYFNEKFAHTQNPATYKRENGDPRINEMVVFISRTLSRDKYEEILERYEEENDGYVKL